MNEIFTQFLQPQTELGNPYPGCERELIYKKNKMQLFRYKSLSSAQISTPLLIVYALVNRPTVLDLDENISLIKGLLTRGIDVYLIDWGYPDAMDAVLTMQDYIGDYLHHCVKLIQKKHQRAELNLLGICQGGVFALAYASLYPKQIKNLITMVTPVDFHTPENRITQLIKEIDINLLVDTLQNIPGTFLSQFFISLKPYQLTLGKYLDFLKTADNPVARRHFLLVEHWLYDTPDQAGDCFRQFAQEYYQQNLLIAGKCKLGRRNIKLKNITMPVLNMMAKHDHLVPTSASIVLNDYISSHDYTSHVFSGGHIGIYISPRAQEEIPNVIGEWLGERDS